MSGSNAREQAIFEITNREVTQVDKGKTLDEIWASDVFTLTRMEEALSKRAYKAMKNTMETGAPLDPNVADNVAAAMKAWAISKGANYFSHIFLSSYRFHCRKTRWFYPE